MGWDNSFQTSLTLPTGATSGERIVIDGQAGTITVYAADDQVSVLISDDGTITSYGTDPQSGLRTVAIMQNGSFDRNIIGVPGDLGPAFMAIGYNGFDSSVITWYHAASADGCFGPSMDMTSETLPGANDADVELATQNYRILANWWSMNNGPFLGMGIYGKAELTGNVNFGTTETVLMTTNSMTWQAGHAYRVHIWGLANASAQDFAYFRLRKGTTTAGTTWKDQMRVNSLATAPSSNVAVDLAPVLVNRGTSDIVSAVCLTGQAGASSWQLGASAGNRASLAVEDIGSATDWPGQPIS